jgi:hypothetical protein
MSHVFLSYNLETETFVETIALRLRGDARLSFWFAPWHSVPGRPIQEQMEEALLEAEACALFIGPSPILGWQNEQMRTAIQTRVENAPGYRVIPVLLPGVSDPSPRELPPFLRRYERVIFHRMDDEHAFRRLLAGILGLPPIQIEGYLENATSGGHPQEIQPLLETGLFEGGHALVIGVARYPHYTELPGSVLEDARDLAALLSDPARGGYQSENIHLLLDEKATRTGIFQAVKNLAENSQPDNTVVVFFSGHGLRTPGSHPRSYLLPYDTDPNNIPDTAISSEELTNALKGINAGRLLVLLDSCHSGGTGEPKGAQAFRKGLDAEAYVLLSQGRGRVVIASSRAEEVSWTLEGMRNSLFTHYLLEALSGGARSLGDGTVRVFDVFRHVAERVPLRAAQHPVFKASDMETDFAVALMPRL